MNEILHSIPRVFRLIQCKAKNFQYAHKKNPGTFVSGFLSLKVKTRSLLPVVRASEGLMDCLSAMAERTVSYN